MVPLSCKQGALHNELTLNARIVGNSELIVKSW